MRLLACIALLAVAARAAAPADADVSFIQRH
jgi:hypothetical protein